MPPSPLPHPSPGLKRTEGYAVIGPQEPDLALRVTGSPLGQEFLATKC